jgi:hypothetical protein
MGKWMWIHIFLTSTQAGVEWTASHPGRFTVGEWELGTHWIGGWDDSRAGLDDVEKRKCLTLPGLELRPLDPPECSWSYTDYAIPVLGFGLDLLQPHAHSGSSLADFSTMKMQAIRSSETSVYTISTLCHIPEDGIFHSHCRENLKP